MCTTKRMIPEYKILSINDTLRYTNHGRQKEKNTLRKWHERNATHVRHLTTAKQLVIARQGMSNGWYFTILRTVTSKIRRNYGSLYQLQDKLHKVSIPFSIPGKKGQPYPTNEITVHATDAMDRMHYTDSYTLKSSKQTTQERQTTWIQPAMDRSVKDGSEGMGYLKQVFAEIQDINQINVLKKFSALLLQMKTELK